MDTIEKQIDEFRYEAAEGTKVRIVGDLAVNDDERVIPFLLEVLADPDEFALARVEAAKLLGSGLEAHRDQICEVLAAVIESTHESDAIFIHALEAASAYHHYSGELREVMRSAEARMSGQAADPHGDRTSVARDAELALGFLEELGGLDV